MSVILLWVSSAHLSPLKCGVFFFFLFPSPPLAVGLNIGNTSGWGIIGSFLAIDCPGGYSDSTDLHSAAPTWPCLACAEWGSMWRWYLSCHAGMEKCFLSVIFFPFAATRKGWGMSRSGSLFQNRVPSCLMTRQQTSHSCFPTFHKCTSITSFLLVSVCFNRTFQYLYKDEHSGLPSCLFSSEYTIRLCSCLNVVLSLTYRLWQADCRIPSANHSMLGNGSENINHFFFLVIC